MGRSMLNFVFQFHSGLRWLIVLVAIVAILRFAYGWLGKQGYAANDRKLMSALTGMVDLQLVLGFIFLIGDGIVTKVWAAYRWEHMTIMLLAIVVLHASAKWRNEPSSEIKFRNNLAAVVLAMLFIFVGVMRLPQGW